MKGFNGIYVCLVNNDNFTQDRLDTWGTYDLENKIAGIDFYLSEYMPSWNYGVTNVKMVDQAKNSSNQYFTDSPQDEKRQTVEVISVNPDTEKPEIDVNNIYICKVCKPRSFRWRNLVYIIYYARDNKLGLGEVSYKLPDPQGVSHMQYHYHENFAIFFFKGDSTEWKEYKINIVLPRGSAPGICGLEEIWMVYKAKTEKNYNFTENIHFEVGWQSKLLLDNETNISIGNIEATQGEEVLAPVVINNIDINGINNLNFSIKYDNRALKLVDVIPGDLIRNSEDLKFNALGDGGIYNV